MSKKLSIIVPVYNMATEGKLNYCLDSLVGQTIRGLYDYEILCVDDASTDDSLEILLDYQKRYPELVCVIPNPVNLRQGGAKNAGLRVAQGEWIGFIDSDDWVSPDYYEKLLKKAEATGADLVGCDYSLVDHHTFEVGKVIVNNTPDQTGDLTKEKHERLFMRPGSMVLKIYKHSVIRENHLDFPEHIFYEDNCAGPLWSLYFRRFERVEEPLYYYYQHAVSTVHHITEEKCRDRMKAAELLWAIPIQHEAGYICAMLFIIPGFPFITSGIDLAKLDMRSGLERLAYALIIIAVATLAAWMLALVLHLKPMDFLPLNLSKSEYLIFRLIASFFGVLGFSVMFNSPLQLAATAGIIGAIANTTRLELVDLASFPPAAAAFLGALLAGLLASMIKTSIGYPRISLTVPSIVIMVPGLYLYRAIYNIGITSINTGAFWFTEALLIIMALPLGLIFARIITDKTFRRCS